MGLFKQLGLLLHQNLIERKRRWLITVLEVGWPIILFAICVVVRDLKPAEPRPECHYVPRSMPSSGVFPFVQSFVCNLDSKPDCSAGEETALQKSRQISSAFSNIEQSLLENNLQFEKLSKTFVPLLTNMQKALATPEVKKLLDQNMTAGAFFKEPDSIKDMLVNKYGIEPNMADAFLESTLNMTMAKDLLLGIKTTLCPEDNSTWPLKSWLITPRDSSVSAEEINEYICTFDQDSIDQLVSQLQQQINTTALYDLMKSFVALVNADAATILSDVEHMLETLTKLSALRNLASDLPNVQALIDFGMDTLKFIRAVMKDAPINPQLLGEFLNKLDPVITLWTNNDKIWQDVKRGLHYLDVTLSWVGDTIRKLPDIRLSLGDLYKDGGRTLIEHLNMTLADAELLIDAMSKSTISFEKILDFQSKLISAGDMVSDPQFVLCEAVKAMFGSINFPDNLDQTQLETITSMAVKTFCEMNSTAIVIEMMSKLNLNYLLNEFAGYGNSTAGLQPLDLQSILEAAWEIYDIVLELRGYFEKYQPLFEKLAGLDVVRAFQIIQNTYQINANSTYAQVNEAWINGIASVMDLVEAYLRMTPIWPYIRSQLVYQNLFSSLVKDAFLLSIEVTNMTYNTLAQPAMDQMVSKVMSIDSQLPSLIYEKLTQPKILNRLIMDPDNLAKDLCADLAGTLELYRLSSSVVTQLTTAMCQMGLSLPGVPANLKAIGEDIRNKINLIVLAFNDSSVVESSAYNQYASMSLSLKLQGDYSRNVMQLAETVRFDRLPVMMTMENTSLWQQYSTMLPYSILSTIMEVTGSSLEQSLAWEMAKSHVTMMEAVMEKLFVLLDRQEQLVSDQTSIGRIMDWIMTYGPEKMTLNLKAMQDPVKMQKVVEILTSGNPMDILKFDCDQQFMDWFYGAGALSSLEMEKLTTVVCNPNMTQILFQEILTTYAEPFTSISKVPETSQEIDWVAMSKRMVDLPLRMKGTFDLFSKKFMMYDWSAWTRVMNATSTAPFDLAQLATLIPGLIGQVDQTFENTTEWRMLKHIMNIVDVTIVNTADRYDQIAENGLTLNTILANSTHIKNYILLQSRLSPVFVKSFFDTVIDPVKLFNELFTANFTGRSFCNGITITQFIDIENATQAQMMDDLMCNTNWEAMLYELQTDRVNMAVSAAVVDIIQGLQYGNLTNLDLDYQAIGLHISEMIESLKQLQNFTGPYFPELMRQYNISTEAILSQAAWQELLDKDPVTYWPAKLDEIKNILKDPATLNEIGSAVRPGVEAMSRQLLTNLYFSRAYLQQIRALLDAAKANGGYFSLSDLVLPGELRTMLKALDESPAMTDITLYSLYQLMGEPQKIAALAQNPQLFMMMCDDIAVYKEYFTLPPDSDYTIDEVQQAMCDLNINITTLMTELVQDFDGFAEALQILQNPNMTVPWEDNLFAQTLNASLQSQILTALLANSSLFTFKPPQWVNQPVWSHVFEKLQNYTTEFVSGLSAMDGVRNMIFALGPVVDQQINSAELRTRKIAAYLQGFLSLSHTAMKEFEASGFSMTKLAEAIDNIQPLPELWEMTPDMIEAIFLTATEPGNVVAIVKKLTMPPANWTAKDVLYNEWQTLDSLLIKPVGNKASFNWIREAVYNESIESLLPNAANWNGGAQLLAELLNPSTPPSNFSFMQNMFYAQDIFDIGVRAMQYYNATGLPMNDIGVAFSEWTDMIQVIESRITNMTNQPFNRQSWASLMENLQLELMVPEALPVIHVTDSVIKMLVEKLQPFTKSVIRIEEFFQNYNETSKALQLLADSRSIVEIIMLSGVKPEFRALFSYTQPQQALAYVCNPSTDASDFLEIPPGASAEANAIKDRFCSIDWEIVVEELMTNLEINEIQQQVNNTSPVDWGSFFTTIDELIATITTIANVKPVIADYPWLNETAWKHMIDRVTKHYASMTLSFQFYKDLMFSTLTQNIQMLDGLLTNKTEIKSILYVVHTYVTTINHNLHIMETDNYNPLALIESLPEASKLLDIMDDLPGYVDALLQTLLQPDKIVPMVRTLMNTTDPLFAFCSLPDINSYFVLMNNTATFEKVQTAICAGINFEKVMGDLASLSGNITLVHNMTVEERAARFGSIGDLLLDTSDMIDKVIDHVTANMTSLPQWASPQVWGGVITKFADSITKFNPFNLLDGLQQLGAEFLPKNISLPQLHVADAVMNVIIKRLAKLTSVQQFNVTTLLLNSPETVKAINLLKYLDDIVNVLIASGPTPKFQLLTAIGDPMTTLKALCTNSSDTFLSLPPGSNADLDTMLNKFCAVDWLSVANEAMSEYEIEQIISQLNNTSPVDFNALTTKLTFIGNLIAALVESPPEFVVDQSWDWLNVSIWEEIFNRLTSADQMVSIDTILHYVFKVLMPMFDNNPEFRRFAVVFEKVLSTLKDDLSLLNQPGRNLTIADILANSPELAKYIETALSLSPDVYSLLLNINFRTPGELQILIGSLINDPDNFQTNVCDGSLDLTSYLVIPSEVNITAVREFFCSTNASVLLAHVYDKFDVSEVLAAFSANATADWQKVYNNVREIASLINQFIKEAPTVIPPFDPMEFPRITKNMMDGINWNDAEVYLTMSESMMRWLRLQPYWKDIQPYFEINQIVSRWIVDLVSRLDVTNNGLTINLADLFPNATRLNNYLQAALSLDEDTAVNLMYATTVRSYKINYLIPQIQQGNFEFLCDSQKFADVFEVPASADLAALTDAMCQIVAGNNSAFFVQELKDSLTIDNLIMKVMNSLNGTSAEVFRVREMYRLQMELTNKIMSFMNVTQIMYNDVNVLERFQRLTNETVFMKYLAALTENMGTDQVRMIGEMLNQMMPLLRMTDWWAEAEPYFRMMKIMAEVGARRTDPSELSAVNLTIATLIRDSTMLRNLLIDTFQFAPDIVHSLLAGEITISPADLMNITSPEQLQSLLCRSIRFPPSVNETAVRSILCDTQYQQVLDELLIEFDFDILIQELGKVNMFSNMTSDFDWVELLENTYKLSNNLMNFFMKLRPPPVTDFFLYDGTVADWLEKMTQSLNVSLSQQEIMKRLATVLNSLESSLAGYPEYRKVIMVSQIIQNYLDMALKELDKLSGEITLEELLRNNTELISLIKQSFEAAPEILEFFTTQPMKVNQLVNLLSQQQDPCTIDLTTLFGTIDSVEVEKLQDLFCQTNMTALFIRIKQEVDLTVLLPLQNVNPNATSFDWAGFMSRFGELGDKIGQLVQTPPTLSPDILSLVNVTEYQRLFERVADFWKSYTFEFNAESFSGIMNSLTPLLYANPEFGMEISKMLHAAQLLLTKINEKLEMIMHNGVSLDTLLGGATGLKNYLNITLNLPPSIISDLMQSPLTGQAMSYIVQGRAEELCSLDTDQIFQASADKLADLESVKNLICNANLQMFLGELSLEFNIDQILNTLAANQSDPIQWDVLFTTSQKLIETITEFTKRRPNVASDLLEAFNMDKLQQILDSVMSADPLSLLKLLNTVGPLVTDASGEAWPIIQSTLYPLIQSLTSVNKVLSDLASSGMDLESVINNSTALFELIRKQQSASVSTTSDIIYEMLVPSITAVLGLPIVQGFVCNETAVNVMLPNMPPQMDVTELLCGKNDSSWMNEMKARNISPYVLITVDSAIQRYYFDSFDDPSFNLTEYFTLKLSAVSERISNITLGSLADPIRELVDVLPKINAIPSELLKNFNMSYWSPIINNFLEAYAKSIPISMLENLNLLEPLLRDQSFWKDLQTALEATQQYLTWINDKLDELAKKGDSVDISDLLPNYMEAKAFLESALSDEGAAELLALSFNPKALLTALQSDPKAVFCDVATFSRTFIFPVGVDKDRIQQLLCAAAQNNSFVMQKYWKLLDLQTYAKSFIDSLTKPTTQTESVFKRLMVQFERLLKNANVITGLLQAFNKDMPNVFQYINALYSTVMTINDPSAGNVGVMCDAMVNLIDEIPEYQSFEPQLVRVQIIHEIVARFATTFDNVDDFLCDLPSMNISTLLLRIADSDIMEAVDLIQAFNDAEYLNRTSFTCSALIRNAVIPSQRIQHAVEMIMNGSYESCFKQLLTADIALLKDVNTYLGLFSQLQSILNSEAVLALKWLEPIRPLLNEIISGVIGQIQGTRLGTLIDGTAVDDVMSKLLNTSLSTTEKLLDSFVILDKFLQLLNMTNAEAERVVCNPTKLAEIMGRVDVAKVSEMLCNSTETLQKIMDVMRTTLNRQRIEDLLATSSIEGFFSRMMQLVQELFNKFRALGSLGDSIGRIVDMVLSGSSIQDLQKAIPDIQKVLAADLNLDDIIDIMVSLVDLVETRVVQNNTQALVILNDMRIILEGVRGLQSLRNLLSVEIPIDTLTEDDAAFVKYLTENTPMTEQNARDFLNSSFRTTMFLLQTDSLVDVQTKMCDPEQLKLMLKLPSDSDMTYTELSSFMCDEDNADLMLRVMLDLMKQLEISNLVESLIKQKLNLDTAELSEAFTSLQVTMNDIKAATTSLRNITSFALPNYELPTYDDQGHELPTASKQTSQQAPSLTSLMCGKDASIEEPTGFQREQAALNELTANLGNSSRDVFSTGDAADDEDLFSKGVCEEMKKKILNMNSGRYLWVYLKPLLAGKVLYSPDNEITRQIVQNANSSFSDISKLFSVIKSVVKSNEEIKRTLNGSSGVETLKEILSKPAAQSLLPNDVTGDSVLSQLDLFTSAESQYLLTSLSEVVKYGECISFNRFVGVDSEEELEKQAKEAHERGQFIAGVVFLNADSPSREKRAVNSSAIPKHIKYKIRMDIDNVESTFNVKPLYYSASPRDSLLDHMRYLRGFIQIQEMIDRAIIKLQAGDNSNLTEVSTRLQQMPATCYMEDDYMGYLYPYVIPVVMALAWLFAVAHAIKNLTAYKESGLEELMKVMGLRGSITSLSWLISTFLAMLLLSVIATIFFVVGKVVIHSNGFIIFLYFVMFSLSSTMFCYMIGSFFTKANLAAAVGVMAFLISYLPYIIYTQFHMRYAREYIHLSSVLSTTAFGIGSAYIARWEQMGVGLQWSNINEITGANDAEDISVQMVFIWMLIDSIIYFLIGWYFSNVIPGKFGSRRPLYFPFTSDYWFGGCKGGKPSKMKKSMPKDSNYNQFETASSISVDSLNAQESWQTKLGKPDSQVYRKAAWLKSPHLQDSEYMDLPVGVSINNLRKKYSNGKLAVDGLNLVLYEGHVTAFLGRNGAGKTTTINMLTGMTSASSGQAVIDGYSVSNGMSKIRENLGYCPQHDLLFDFMTVKEHMRLFANMKSNEPSSVINYDIEDMLSSMGLWTVRHELVGSLSGGMKRRLSVALAFIGGSKVIILDEPTSSIDPNGRRVIWDVILKHRPGRTIIICTHHLDEADIIGDRVAILDNGKIRAEGSPIALKKQHASGYQLFAEKLPNSEQSGCNTDDVTAFIKNYCPGAILMSDVGSSLTYTLPSSNISGFDALFTALNQSLADLQLSGFGVSDSTLYEVFENITETTASDEDSKSDLRVSVANQSAQMEPSGTSKFGSSSSSAFCISSYAILRKRFIHSIKDLKTAFTLILLPILFVAFALGLSTIVPDRSDQPNLKLETSMYPETFSFYSYGQGRSVEMNRTVSTLFEYPGIGTACLESSGSCSNRLSDFIMMNEVSPQDALPDCTCTKNNQNECTGKDPRLDVRTLNSSDHIVHVTYPDLQDYLLRTHHFYRSKRYGGWSFTEDSGQLTATVWFDNRAYHSAVVYMNALSNMLLRAAVRSDNSEYGITTYNHPLSLSKYQLSVRNTMEKTADLGISIVLLAAFSFIPAGLCIYLVLEHTREEKHLQYVSGVSPIKYWITAYFWDMIMFLLPIGLALAIAAAYQIPAYSAGINSLALFLLLICYAWAVLPFMYMTIKSFNNTLTAFFTLLMANLFLGIVLTTIVYVMSLFSYYPSIENAYLVLKRVFLIFPQYSFTSGIIQLTLNQVLMEVFEKFSNDVDSIYHPFNVNTGIVWNLVSMAIQGVVFFIITLMTELKAANCDGRISRKLMKADDIDEDVLAEHKRVFTQKRQAGSMVVTSLSKQYRLHNLQHVIAVKDLTFAVQPGEVFGLCGVNGAGKTTTFRMLTGQLMPTTGMAELFGKGITSSHNRKQIGYCPQVDALDLLLTGRQLLKVYCDLKGIKDSERAIDEIITAFEMKAYANKQIKCYSGGMRRKLCVALAMIGNPRLIFLDEPTAGMDPVARRTVWNQIISAAQRGSSVVLTTHSMTECEALCTRLAIMVNGKMACLGSSQHLKNKFGHGYTLKVKVSGPPPHVARLINFVRTVWPHSTLKDQHLNTCEFSIPQTSKDTLGSIFSKLETERDNYYISEYSVFQTTLDQIFIQFARNQQDQIDGSSEGDVESSDGGSSSTRYVDNIGFNAEPEKIALKDEKTRMDGAMRNLDGDQSWNTVL